MDAPIATPAPMTVKMKLTTSFVKSLYRPCAVAPMSDSAVVATKAASATITVLQQTHTRCFPKERGARE